jgi:hypothetical protein
LLSEPRGQGHGYVIRPLAGALVKPEGVVTNPDVEGSIRMVARLSEWIVVGSSSRWVLNKNQALTIWHKHCTDRHETKTKCL